MIPSSVVTQTSPKPRMIKKGTIDLNQIVQDQTPLIYTEITTPSSIGDKKLNLENRKKKAMFARNRRQTMAIP